jgi:moderate conductance mechanosensitive channel
LRQSYIAGQGIWISPSVSRIFDRCLAPLALLALLLIGGAALAQSPPVPAETSSTQRFALTGKPAAAPLSSAEIEGLIATLEDPQRRDDLIANLRTLQAARGDQPASEEQLAEDLVTDLVGEIAKRTETVRRVSVSIIDSLDQIPALVQWLEARIADPAQRSQWLAIALRIAAYVAIAVAAYLGVALALRPVRRRLSQDVDDNTSSRLLRLLVILLLDLLPLVAFVLAIIVVATVATKTIITPSEEARRVVELLIQAVILARVSIALARLIFAPKAPGLRLLSLSNEAAGRCFRWTRWLASTTIYGYFALEAGRAVGLPWTIEGFLRHFLFLVVALMVVTLIVRSREPVGHALASLAEEEHNRLVRRLPWRGLAGMWHLLAALYVLLVFAVWALKIPGGFQLLFGATLGTALVVAGCWLALRVTDQLFGRGARRVQDGDEQLSGIDRRIGRYLPVAGGVVKALIVLGAGIALLEVWGFGTLSWLRTEAGQNLLGRLLIVFAVVVVAIAVWEAISLAIERSISEEDEEGNLRLSNRTRTLLNIMRNFLAVFLSLIALFLILSELGLNIAPLLAGAGVVGLAIGFGSQKLVQDIITGMFVLLGDTIRIGDVVEVASRVGVVEQMTMRTVVLREYGGNVHTIPYSAIDTVTNYTKDFSYAVFNIGVAYRENVDQVMEALREIGAEMNRDNHFRRLILEPLEVAGVDAFADSAVVIKARLKTRPLKQWEVAREFNRRVKNRFDELGIEIPFPHQTVYFGVDKAGRAPPVQVELASAATAGRQDPEPTEAASPPQVLARSRGA